MMDLLQLNSRALSLMHTAEQAEAFSVRSRTMAVYIDDSRVSNVETKDDAGLALRLIQGKRLGTASSTLTEGSLERCAEHAKRVADLSPVDDGLRGFSDLSKESPSSHDNIDEKVIDSTADELAEIAEAIVSAAGTDVPRGLLRAATVDSAVSNSNGVEVLQRRTMVYGHFTSMVDEPSPGEGVQTFHSNSLDIDVDLIGHRLRETARSHASARSFKGKESLATILPPSQLEDMTLSSLGSALDGENVVLGRSPWKDRIGQRVASECLTVMDDPLSPSLLSGTHDDEGTPMRQRTLIADGVLQGFMFDNFNGESTGNAWRRDPVDAQGIYRMPLRIGPANLTVPAGDITVEEMVAETGDGILVERLAWPEVDPLTGRFGLELRCGHLIRNGVVVGTVKNALLTGEMFDAWRDVLAVSKERERGARSNLPTISFGGARLVGV